MGGWGNIIVQCLPSSSSSSFSSFPTVRGGGGGGGGHTVPITHYPQRGTLAYIDAPSLPPCSVLCVSVCVCTMADFSHQQKKGRKRRRSERRRDGGKDHYQKGPLLTALSSPACAVLMHCIPPPSLSFSTPWFSHSNGHTKIPVFVPKNDVHRGSAQDVRVVSEERGEIEAILFWMRAPPLFAMRDTFL